MRLRKFRQLQHELNVLDALVYLYRRQRWMLHLPWTRNSRLDAIKLDRPIFLLGVKGGGLTLVSRMLRRSKNVVTLSGNATYWAGADEMYVALEQILPWQLRERRVRIPGNPEFWGSRGWAYACDQLIPHYQLDERDTTEEARKRFVRAIKLCIRINSADPSRARFLDKSQVFSVKVPLIRQMLGDSKPIFIAIARDPFAMCYRGATKTHLRSIHANFEFRLRTACEHWRNTYEAILGQQKAYSDVRIFRMEDLLNRPAEVLQDMCQFAELEYLSELLPGPDDSIPRGSRNVGRWYPLNPDLNSKWTGMVDAYSAGVIRRICGDTAERIGYEVAT